MTAYDIIRKPVVTEASMAATADRKYTFVVDKRANKVEIARAIEKIFDVKVEKVHTINVKAKPKRVRYRIGYTRTWKKAMVTLADGDKIELFAS